jgi:nucleotide-binding universal stress UspA family protein
MVHGMINKILVAVDASVPAGCAVGVAVGLARQLGAQLRMVHVVDSWLARLPELAVYDDAVLNELRSGGENALANACARVPDGVPCERVLLEGDPPETITTTARDWPADLIVIGSDSHGRLAHFLLGSTADSVVRRASCPVVTVRATDDLAGANKTSVAATV